MFKNLKSLFIVEDEEPTQSRKAREKEAGKGAQATNATSPAPEAEMPATSSTGRISQKFMEVLLQAMQTNNIEGFDYLEFKKSLRSLEKMPMDEPTRFQSAFAMAQTMGASPEKLVQAAQHYLSVLQQEEKKFQQALAGQKDKQIGAKQGEIAQLDEIVKSKAEQIRALTQEIETHQKQMQTLKEEINDAAVKVESTKNDFIASYQSLVDQIKSDIDNIQKYLK